MPFCDKRPAAGKLRTARSVDRDRSHGTKQILRFVQAGGILAAG